MQVHTETKISDLDSVVIGVQQLRQLFEKTKAELSGKPASRAEIVWSALGKYNRDANYISEIFQVLHVLWAQIATDYRTEFESMHVRPVV